MGEKQVWKVYHEEHEIVETVRAALKYIQEKHGISENEAIDLCTNDHNLRIPATVFSSEQCPLEAIVRFLKDEHGLSFSEISALLARDARTIWTTYRNSLKKDNPKHAETPYQIPVMVLSDRKLSILELVTEFLIDVSQLSFKETARLLCRHENTVRTAYARGKRKRDG